MSQPASNPTAKGSTLVLTLLWGVGQCPAIHRRGHHLAGGGVHHHFLFHRRGRLLFLRPALAQRPVAARTRPNSTARIFRKTACCIVWFLIFESVGCAVQPSPTLEVHPQIAGARKARAPAPSASQFCIEHLRERVRGRELGAPRGAVVGDAAKVSGRQRRRPAMQADGVAEAQMKWSARRAAPSVRALNACCIRNCWGGGSANGRNEPGPRL